MKRINHLFELIITFENLYNAAKKAQKGKRYKKYVLEFNSNLESNLLTLQQELKDKTYQPGGYKKFTIYDPVKREISAAPYRDRIVHHALCNIIEPIFEKTFIQDSYANRKDKGTHKYKMIEFCCSKYKVVIFCFCNIILKLKFEFVRNLIYDFKILNAGYVFTIIKTFIDGKSLLHLNFLTIFLILYFDDNNLDQPQSM